MTTAIEGRERRGEKEGGGSGGATAWLWLTAPVAVLAAVAAGGELLFDVFRGDAPYFVAQTVGQDFVTLLVAVPALVAGAVLAGRGSQRARLVWLGVLAYLVYTYAIYALQVRFNGLFLVYVALLGCALYALVGGLATTDFGRVRARFADGMAAKATAVFLGLVAALFYLTWLGEAVPATLAGTTPQSVLDNGTPTNAVHVLDMAWVLPAMALTAVWLWRGRTVAYALAGVLLSFVPLLTLAIGGMMVSMHVLGQPVALGMGAVFGALAALGTGMLVWYLSRLEAGLPASTGREARDGRGPVEGR